MARPQGRVENRPVDHASKQQLRKLATGLDLIEETESRISSQGSGGSVAQAIGRTLIGGGVVHCGPGAPAGSVPDDVPLVQHTLYEDGARSTAPILLVAGTHQEAVDHCLVAHLAAERIACRVESGIVESVAHGLGLAELPERGELDRARQSLGSLLPSSESDLLTILTGCREAAAEGFGRSVAAPVSSRPGGARLVVVTLGWFADLAEDIAERSGGKIAHVALRLLRPFPLSQVKPLLSTAETVLVAAPPNSGLHFEACCRIEEAATGESSVRMVRLTREADSTEFLQALSAAYPSEVWSDLQTPAGGADRRHLRLAVVPSGAESARLLLDAGSILAGSFSGRPRIRLERKDASLASIDIGGVQAESEPPIDVLAVLGDRFVPAQEAIRRVRDSGCVAIPAPGGSAEDAWKRLSNPVREAILERSLKLMLLDAEGSQEGSQSIWARSLAELAQSGTASVAVEADLAELAKLEITPSSGGPAVRFFPVAAAEEPVPPALLEEVRRFHLTGRFPERHVPFSADVPLQPLAASVAARPFHESFPFALPEEADVEPEPLFSLLSESLADEKDAPIITQLLPELMQLTDLSIRSSVQGMALQKALSAALSRLSDVVELSEAGRQSFDRESQALLEKLTQPGKVVGFRSETWFQFYHWTLRRERLSRIRQFRAEATSLLHRLEALLKADQGLRPESRSATSMASTLGSSGLSLIDPERLAGVIPERRGSRTLESDRLDRIQKVLTTLRSFVGESGQAPDLFVVSARELPFQAEGLHVLQSESPFETARGVFEGLASRALDVVKALRIGRLEVEGEYDPEIHDGIVRDLTWEALEADELLLIPAVLVLESGHRLAESTLAEFHRLIETGWPVHVCISVNESLVSGDNVARTLAGVLPDPGYLGLAQREAFVLQSSIAQPTHLLAGLRRMWTVPGPAVCVLSFPDQDGSAQWLWTRCQSAWLSRSIPLFAYDPWAGESWADRFSLEGNPDSEKNLVTVEVADLGTQDASLTIDEALTFAHVLAQDPRFREQFWVIPSTAWSDEQKLVEEFLRDFAQPPLGVAPFIWVVDEQGRLQRAVATREVISACRDRLRSWRTLQELAGVKNVYVERAVERVRQETLQEALAELEKSREEARRAGAEEAIGRLAAVLSDLDSLDRALPSQAAVAAPPAERGPAVKPAPSVEEAGESAPAVKEEAAAEEEEEDFGAEAYIDSFLCTSCNECINLNPRMFSYNGDRQAFVADPSAGNYAELVKAAEACPARCIHPGAPRAGDDTATPEVVERGKAFR